MKHDSYKTDVIKSAAIAKGKLIGLTISERNPHLSLKKYGMDFVEDAININDKVYEYHSEFIDSKADRFNKLFTIINKNGSPKYLPDKSLNRYLIGGDDCNL